MTNSSQTCFDAVIWTWLLVFWVCWFNGKSTWQFFWRWAVNFKSKKCRCLQFSHLRLGFQHILCFCGKIGYPVVLLSKLDLVQLTNVLFFLFLVDFSIVSSIAVCVCQLSRSVLLFWLTSKFFKMWFRVSKKVLSL